MPDTPAAPNANASVAAPPADQLVRTPHAIKLGKKTLKYTATAGTVVLREEWDKDGQREGDRARATIFHVAYTLDDGLDRRKRPITFVFNGGPGSSSVWLHLGLMGPKRVAMDTFGHAPKPPYELVENVHTLLAVSDLVFIDPVGTGYSRMMPGEPSKEFHDFQRDLDSVGEFIRLYCSRHGRWASPKFLAGESYGTTRAVGLAGLLQEKHGLYFNGLMLISLALEFSHLRFDAGNDLPYPLFLPTYAATAWFHGKLDTGLQKRPLRSLLDEVEAFAIDTYLPALFKGRDLSSDAAARLTQSLARYTGLSEAYIETTRRRIEIQRFCKELLRTEGKTVGRLDSRYTSHDRDNAGEHFEGDPAMYAILGAYATCINDYIRSDLQVTIDLPYNTLVRLYDTWGYKDFTNRYVNVADTLRRAMTFNPHLQVLVANGYYDFATPHFASDHTFRHLAGPAELTSRVEQHYYEAGHMMYAHQPSLKSLAAAMLDFVDKAST